MKTKTKVVLLALCMVALIAVSVLGTMAYLTSQDTVTNTFTVGNVQIKLDEAAVDINGDYLYKDDNKTVLADRVKKNDYKLLPGHTYVKDPTVTVVANSETAYVRILVTATFQNALNDSKLTTELDNIFIGYNEAIWKRNAKEINEDKTVITYEYRYAEKVPSDDKNTVLPALFTGIKIPDSWTNTDLAALGGIKIEIVAQAIQADGFADAAAAWAAFPTTTTTNP